MLMRAFVLLLVGALALPAALPQAALAQCRGPGCGLGIGRGGGGGGLFRRPLLRRGQLGFGSAGQAGYGSRGGLGLRRAAPSGFGSAGGFGSQGGHGSQGGFGSHGGTGAVPPPAVADDAAPAPTAPGPGDVPPER